MSKLQDWCKEISEVVVAAANGEKIQISYDGKTWADKTELEFDSSYKYRIKPRTIKIGAFDVPEPMRIPPVGGKEVFSPMPASKDMYWSWPWWGSEADLSAMNRGVVHNNKDSAITHSLAIISLTSAK